jgi:predicted metal-dependent HD superfamily phosphohydrolase
MLKNKFQTLCQNFTSDQELVTTLWNEIEERHTEPTRYYHTLHHLEHIYSVLPTLDNVTEFAIFYHDIVYDASKSDNEEQSALLCEKHLSLFGITSSTIEEVTTLIRETKTHKPSTKRNALFLDADLAILGSSEEVYENYTLNVRKEYAIYSDDVYRKGRQKVLNYFLEKESIYESDYFYELYEKKARKNLNWELTL